MNRTGLLHATFELLVSRPKVEANHEHSAGTRWVLIGMTVGPFLLLATAFLALTLTFALLPYR